MDKLEIGKSPFSKVNQIGVVVRDLDKAIEYYESLGIGPFKPISVNVIERKVRGVPNDEWKFRISVADMGPVQFELVQPVAGESIQKEFLETKGEGINHLGFYVDDFDNEVAKLVEKGYEVIASTRGLDGYGDGAYFRTDEIGGVLLELIRTPPK